MHENKFREAIQATGIEFRGDIIPDGNIHRCHVEGDNSRSKNGWYVFHGDDIPAGAFGCFKRDISGTWSSKDVQTMADDEKARYVWRIEAARQQRVKEEEQIRVDCRKWCNDTFLTAKPATNDHPYLKAKGVHSYGLKQLRDNLLLPLRDCTAVLQGIQFIMPDGRKKFKTGTAKQGNYFSIGTPQENILLICEGYATGASLHESTGHAVAVAFDAGNLMSVAKNLQKKFPEMKLAICADNDESGVGQEKARAAALAVGGVVVMPPGVGDDFNDLHQKEGAAVVKAIVEAGSVATVATVAVANHKIPSSTVECDLDFEPADIQKLRGALAVIPPGIKFDRHTPAEIIGWGLRHVESGIEPNVGASLCAEWDKLTGGKSLEVFATCDPAYNYTAPVTTASIFALAKANGWAGQIPWATPELLITIEKSAPYPLEALPGSIGAAVAEVGAFVQSPVSLNACSAISVISTVVQGLVDVRRAEGLDGPASTFTLVLAESGERKTSSDGHFSKPIQQWEAERAEAAKPEIKRYNADIAVWEANRSGLMSAISTASKGNKRTDELADQVKALEDNKPEEPKVPRLLYADATPEALAYSLAHKWPVGAVMSSEAGVVLGGHAMGKDSAMRNMGILNCFWDGTPVPIDRRTTASYTVRNVRLTMGLAVQPDTIRAFLDSSKGLARGIGFLARFLIAWPESTQGRRMFKDAPKSWPELARFHRRLGALLDYPLAFDSEGFLSPVMLELTPEAKKAWVAFYNDVEAELNPGRDMAEAKDVASKAADNAVRLAALFHVFEVGIDGQISLEHMNAGAAIAGWHLYEARRFMGEIAIDTTISNAVALDRWLIGWCKNNHVEEINRRILQQNGPNCIRPGEKLTAAIGELVNAGRVRETKTGKQKNIEINPKLLEG